MNAQELGDAADRRVAVFGLVGAADILAGLVGLATIGYWYAADMGWTGSGSTIVASRSPIFAAALLPVAAIAFGVITLLIRSDVPFPSLRGTVLAVANLLLAASVVLAVDAYPQVESARVIAIGEDGAIAWQTDIPLTRVLGIRSETDRMVTLEGAADRRACNTEHRAVTLDRRSGEVLDVEELPTYYDDQSEVPPPPKPVVARRGGFDVEQGSAPFICRN